MALFATHNQTKFGVGDMVRVNHEITEGEKTRVQAFEGMVIRIKGREEGKTVTVRRIGSAQVGIEKIYPLSLPTIKSIEIVQKGSRGIRRAKLYYTRQKSAKEVSKIYKKAALREEAKKPGSKPSKKEIHKKLVKKNAPMKESKTKTATKKTADASKKK